MATFAEIAIADYRFSFANQGKQLPFSISFAENKRKFAVCHCSKQMEVAVSR
jgi:hypothetical protein